MNPDDGSGAATMDIENMPMNDYSFDDFKMAWRRFAYTIKDDKPTFYNALIKRDPVIKNTELYILEVDNEVQVDYIFPILSDLVKSRTCSSKKLRIQHQN